MTISRFRLAILCLSLPLAACGQQPENICAEAEAHLAACAGVAVSISAGGSCEGDAAQLAEQALTTSCEALQRNSGKADALSNPVSMAACIGLGIPLVITNSPEGSVCCFTYNCALGENLTCRDYTCVKKEGEGGSCNRHGHCEDHLRCISGECAPPLQEGQSCLYGQCDDELVCGADGTCAPLGAANSACGNDFDCIDRCIQGVCSTSSGPGGLCDPGDNTDCQLGLVCRDGTCQDPPATDGACNREAPFPCGHDETCWAGVCEPRHGVGQACEDLLDCAFGLFCTDQVCSEPGSF